MIWMPLALAWSMRGAILRASTSTRAVAPEHQCLSHMSQITMAVELTGTCSSKLSTRQSPLPLKGSTRVRIFRVRSFDVP